VVDAVIGGGGMVQIPALFAFMPGVAPPPLLGTNKLASAIGTTGAAIQYARSVATPWGTVIPCMAVAFVASLAGAYAVTLIPAEPLKMALPFILAALLVYSWASGTGKQHAPTRSPAKARVIASSGSGVIGFYDGFLGAGTGAFYKLLFVRGLGFSFLNAAGQVHERRLERGGRRSVRGHRLHLLGPRLVHGGRELPRRAGGGAGRAALRQ
jgi:uncharacterized membrane protein YfcA